MPPPGVDADVDAGVDLSIESAGSDITRSRAAKHEAKQSERGAYGWTKA